MGESTKTVLSGTASRSAETVLFFRTARRHNSRLTVGSLHAIKLLRLTSSFCLNDQHQQRIYEALKSRQNSSRATVLQLQVSRVVRPCSAFDAAVYVQHIQLAPSFWPRSFVPGEACMARSSARRQRTLPMLPLSTTLRVVVSIMPLSSPFSSSTALQKYPQTMSPPASLEATPVRQRAKRSRLLHQTRPCRRLEISPQDQRKGNARERQRDREGKQERNSANDLNCRRAYEHQLTLSALSRSRAACRPSSTSSSSSVRALTSARLAFTSSDSWGSKARTAAFLIAPAFFSDKRWSRPWDAKKGVDLYSGWWWWWWTRRLMPGGTSCFLVFFVASLEGRSIIVYRVCRGRTGCAVVARAC